MRTQFILPAAIVLLTVAFVSGQRSAQAGLLAGVDFEGASQNVFDTSPDDLDLTDEITVSSGGSSPMFNGWTLLELNGNNGGAGNLRNDNGATSAGATTPDFPARLESNRTGSWSISIPEDWQVDLDRIEFDVRGATGGGGRDGQFSTSLDGGNFLWEDFNLPGRNDANLPGGWQRIVVDLSGPLYQELQGQDVDFIWRTPSGAIDLDTIQVFGTARFVPEPATFALFGLGGLLAAVAVTRRKR